MYVVFVRSALTVEKEAIAGKSRCYFPCIKVAELAIINSHGLDGYNHPWLIRHLYILRWTLGYGLSVFDETVYHHP